MATTVLPTNTFVVRASSVSSDNTHRKTSTGATTTASGGGKWWAPIFGWSTNADYIDSSSSSSSSSSSKIESSSARSETVAAKSKFSRGCFTEEKARQLRMMTKETASFHDAMYHSAIASRLASDFSRNNSDESDHF